MFQRDQYPWSNLSQRGPPSQSMHHLCLRHRPPRHQHRPRPQPTSHPPSFRSCRMCDWWKAPTSSWSVACWANPSLRSTSPAMDNPSLKDQGRGFFLCLCACMRVCVCACVHACVRVCVCMHVCLRVHSFTLQLTGCLCLKDQGSGRALCSPNDFF